MEILDVYKILVPEHQVVMDRRKIKLRGLFLLVSRSPATLKSARLTENLIVGVGVGSGKFLALPWDQWFEPSILSVRRSLKLVFSSSSHDGLWEVITAQSHHHSDPQDSLPLSPRRAQRHQRLNLSMRTPKVTKKFRFLYNKGVVYDDGTMTSFYN